MNWGRAKTILIILFLVIDILLLSVYVALEQNAKKISQDAVLETVQLLAENGITIDESIIPEKPFMNYQPNMVNAAYDQQNTVCAILGENYSKTSEREYTFENTTLHIDNGQISYQKNKTPHLFESDTSENASDKRLNKHLHSLGFDNGSYVVYNKKLENGILHFGILPRYKEFIISGAKLNGTADRDEILTLNGTWFRTVFAQDDTREQLCSITSVLLKFMYMEKGNPKEVHKIHAYYDIPSEQANAETVIPIPVYLISCADGTDVIFHAKTAELIAKTTKSAK